MSSKALFTQENLDTYLKALAREYKKLGGKGMPAEIILIGGAAILANYGFRESTYDMDALIDASSAMKDAINHVGDEYGLPNGWLNEDFVKTKSYTPKIRQYSVHYKEFGRILEVRTVKAEYLIAMKLVSARPYKNDLSDIVEHARTNRNDSISIQRIIHHSTADVLFVRLKCFIVKNVRRNLEACIRKKFFRSFAGGGICIPIGKQIHLFYTLLCEKRGKLSEHPFSRKNLREKLMRLSARTYLPIKLFDPFC